MIKAHLVLDEENKTPLHTGMIGIVILEDDFFITAGGDGYIKWWNFNDIENAEADEVLEVQIKPVKEKYIEVDGKAANIVNMIKGRDIWLIGD